MRYVVSESYEKRELGRIFFADVAARVGATLKFKSGKAYEVIDIEFFESDLRGTIVQGAVKRLM